MDCSTFMVSPRPLQGLSDMIFGFLVYFLLGACIYNPAPPAGREI